VQAKPPVASVVITVPESVPSEHALGVWRTELNTTFATDITLNPDPVTVYVAPTGPCAGLTVIVGVVIVNGAVPVSWPKADPVAVTVYGVPDAVPEIVTVQLKSPGPPPTVAPQVPIVAPAPMVVVIISLCTNPDPATKTDVPLGPCVGVSVMGGSLGDCAAVADREELGAAGIGVGGGEEPIEKLKSLTETVEVRPAGLTVELAGKVIPVEDPFAPPEEDGEASPAPAEASMAAPTMIIDTSVTSPIVRFRGDRGRAFIPPLGDQNYGVPERPIQERVRDLARRPCGRREPFRILIVFFQLLTPSLAGATTLLGVARAGQPASTPVARGLEIPAWWV
jgi:hypothetical protein